MSKYKKNLIRIGNPGKEAKFIGQKLIVQGVYYLCGGRTAVEVVRDINFKYPACRIVSAPPTSKYFNHIGKVVNISRQVLYPRRRK